MNGRTVHLTGGTVPLADGAVPSADGSVSLAGKALYVHIADHLARVVSKWGTCSYRQYLIKLAKHFLNRNWFFC